MSGGIKLAQTRAFPMVSHDFLLKHHRSLIGFILPGSSGGAESVIDAQLSPVGRQHSASAREGELSRVGKDNDPLLTAAFRRILISVREANCAELSQGWLQQVRQSLKIHMTSLICYGVGIKLSGHGVSISHLVRRYCYFTNLPNPSRMQAVDGDCSARGSVASASILAGGDKIDVSRFRSEKAIRDRAHDGFLLLNHLPEVIGLLLGSRLIICAWIYCVADITSASHGPA